MNYEPPNIRRIVCSKEQAFGVSCTNGNWNASGCSRGNRFTTQPCSDGFGNVAGCTGGFLAQNGCVQGGWEQA